MYRERKKGLFYSIAFHLLLLLLMIFGLPSFLKNEPPIEPTAITVELLPISKISNVKPSDGNLADKPKPEEQKPEDEQKKPSPPVKTSEPTPPPPEPDPITEPKKPEPKKLDQKKEEKKPEPKKPTPPKKQNDDDLEAILKAVKETAQKEKTDKKEPPKEKNTSTPKAISSRFDPSQQMSISEKDAIMGQLAKCWNPPAGAKNAHELVVIINAEFNNDGSYIRAEISNESRSRYNSDSFFRSAADAALRAVRQCSPLKNLDPAKYSAWGTMELHFDPREMLQ